MVDLDFIELREVVCIEMQDGVKVDVPRTFIVHRIDHKQDTLMKIAYKYKVSEMKLKINNDLPLHGDDTDYLNMYDELLIPYENQTFVKQIEEPKMKPSGIS